MYRYLHDYLFAYSSVQHILCCLYCFVCICIVFCLTNVAGFSGLSIRDCSICFANVYLKQIVLLYDKMVM